ncbi:primosomal replication protein N [Polynucleobacter sp. 15G-AUS-farblos]|uniref:primosomal replication protein N n=1 Tax=Polynucleobacter sp. 15G-AUS-farblos TaxID=2689094 RepID=UPI001C0CED8E|nr:primosomal replication protein N [Polynucleobacter sp. 15G-AUS-farblos]MBU3582733.1 primosomal replication protein N [Polynucleobacter sp. 15G-AUS-farblos]
MNHFTLTAILVSKDAIRFTPAGIPVMHCQLEHSGQANEVGVARKIQMSVEALAIGPIQKDLEQMDLGTEAVFEGFLAAKTLRNQRLVFHITHIQLKN